MEWKVLAYNENSINKEEGLLRWMEEESGTYHIRCLSFSDVNSLEKAFLYSIERQFSLEDVLWIVTTKEEWLLARELNIAALPYVAQEISETKKTTEFDQAWIIVEGFDEVDYDFLLKCYQRAKNLPWKILETERCYLRELTLDDLDALYAIYAKPGVTDYMEDLFNRVEEEEYQRAYISNMYRYYGYGMWLVCKKENDTIIGRAGLEHRDYHDEYELEMGYLITPEEQRKGYATEVCKALMTYAKENLDFSRINCLIDVDNTISKHMIERLGFDLCEKMMINGDEMDRYIYCF